MFQSLVVTYRAPLSTVDRSSGCVNYDLDLVPSTLVRIVDPADVAQNSIAPNTPLERAVYAPTLHVVVGSRIPSSEVVPRDVLEHCFDCSRSETAWAVVPQAYV